MLIRALEAADQVAYFAYLNDHLSDNGAGATALFMPMGRSESRLTPEKETAFRAALATPFGQPGWRHAWIALGDDGEIAGHVDLRARPERACAHRALLGMGVHRGCRRQGLGARLMDVAIDWARARELAWIDLEVMGVNASARALYRRCGFAENGEVQDLFRIDGATLSYVSMTLKL